MRLSPGPGDGRQPRLRTVLVSAAAGNVDVRESDPALAAERGSACLWHFPLDSLAGGPPPAPDGGPQPSRQRATGPPCRALGRGELSYAKVRALTRVATPETEERALRIARQALGCEPVTVQFLSSRQMAKRP